MNHFLKIIDYLIWPAVVVMFIWLAFFINLVYDLDWNFYGLRPGELRGLIGILSLPFLHADISHLFSNSVPLLISFGFVGVFLEKYQWKILTWVYLGSGILLWFIGRENTVHVGASAVVYGLLSFMIFHAFYNRHKQTMSAAFILIFLYGSFVYGLFPEYGILIGKNISWDGHLSGFIVGIVVAFIYRNQGPKEKIYFLEDDDDEEFDPENPPYWMH